MSELPRRLAAELLDLLVEKPQARSRLMSMRPSLERDLVEVASAGHDMCTSCAQRLRSAVAALPPESIQKIFGLRAQVVDPAPLRSPRVVHVGEASRLEAELSRLTFEEGVLIRQVTPFYEGDELYAVIL